VRYCTSSIVVATSLVGATVRDLAASLDQGDPGVLGAGRVVHGGFDDRGEGRDDIGFGLQSPRDPAEHGTQAVADDVVMIRHGRLLQHVGNRFGQPQRAPPNINTSPAT
jgi:hypothetical protein